MEIPVVVQAGGRGIRLYPITDVIPKPLIPVGECTMIERVIGQFGTNDITVIVNYMGDLIAAYLKDYKIVKEKKYGGTAGALRLLDIDKDFIFTNCDILVDMDYVFAYSEHVKRNADLTIIATRHIHHLQYGIFDYDKDNRVLDIIEKQFTTYVINTGMYIINPNIKELVDEYMDMDVLIKKAVEKNKKVYLHHILNDKYTDMGTMNRYKEFMKELAEC